MSVQTLYTAATGMEALQQKLDVIANNLANVNTTGFKRDRCNFEDLFYRTEAMPGIQDASGQYTPVGIQTGLGSKVQSTQSDQTQGAFQQTNQPLDVAIQGNGYLQVTDPTGQILYTRAGNLSVNANGAARDRRRHGRPVVGPGHFHSPDRHQHQHRHERNRFGRRGRQHDDAASRRIQMAKFINPQGLLARRQSVQPNRRLRRCDARSSRNQRARLDPARFAGSVECRTCQ